jgi:hypothetical protein
MSFLVATLSISASDEDKLKDAFQNALQWEYDKYSNPIYALFLLNPKTAVLYAQKALVYDLLSRESGNPLQLGGPMSALFTTGDSFPSNCVEIQFFHHSTISQDQIFSALGRIRDLISDPFASFIHDKRLTLRFSSSTEAANACQTLINSKSIGLQLQAQVINVSQFVAVSCSWKGSTTLASTIKRLKAAGQNITNLVQSCLR